MQYVIYAPFHKNMLHKMAIWVHVHDFIWVFLLVFYFYLRWKYTCFDLQEALSSFINNGQLFKVQYIKVKRAGDIFIDEVYIGNGPSTKDLGIKKQSLSKILQKKVLL